MRKKTANDVVGQGGVDSPSYITNSQNNAVAGIPNKRGLNLPEYMAIDSVNHKLFVSDYSNQRVLVFNLDTNNDPIDRVADYVLGQPNLDTGGPALTAGGLGGPHGIVVDTINNRLFVADTGYNRVLVYNIESINNGEDAVSVLGQANFVTSDATTTQVGLSGPAGLTYNSASNTLFVADANNQRIMIFDV
ncbi:MAG: beta-propeller fold lactonase family protein, partial [Patescibacteria group bacterium]